MAEMTFNPPVKSSCSKRKVCDIFSLFFFKDEIKTKCHLLTDSNLLSCIIDLFFHV